MPCQMPWAATSSMPWFAMACHKRNAMASPRHPLGTAMATPRHASEKSISVHPQGCALFEFFVECRDSVHGKVRQFRGMPWLAMAIAAGRHGMPLHFPRLREPASDPPPSPTQNDACATPLSADMGFTDGITRSQVCVLRF